MNRPEFPHTFPSVCLVRSFLRVLRLRFSEGRLPFSPRAFGVRTRFVGRCRSLGAVALLCVSSAFASLPEKVTSVLERSVEASGGRERIAAIKATRLSGTFSMPALGMSGSSVLVQVYPDKLYSMQELPGMGKIVQVCDGDSGWAQDPMQGFRELSPQEISSLKQNESLREMVDFSSTYSSGEWVGETVLDGTKVVVVKLVSVASEEPETHYYGVEDGLLLKKEMIADMGPMGKLPTTMIIHGYQEHKGVVYPSKLEALYAGLSVQLEFTSLEIDPEIDPSLFLPPQ